MDDNKLIVFKDKKIRRIWYNNDWYYVIEYVIYALTESNDPKQYIQKLKSKDEFLKQGWVQFVHTLKVKAKGGKQNMNCANTKSILE